MQLDIHIGFSTTNKLISGIIRWLTGSKASHAWFSFYDETLGTRVVMQAELRGYELITWKRWKTRNKLVKQFKLKHPNDALGLLAIAGMAEMLGAAYDVRSAVFLGLYSWLKNWWNLSRFSPRRTPAKVMCSEATLVLMKGLGISTILDLYEETVSPNDLLQACYTSPELEEC